MANFLNNHFHFRQFVLICGFVRLSTSYLSGQFAETFQNGINLTVIFDFNPISNGLVLYSSDRYRNYFWVKTGENFINNKQMNGTFNGVEIKLTNSTESHGISKCSINVYLKADKMNKSDSFNTTNSNSTEADLSEADFENQTMKTYIWLGYFDRSSNPMGSLNWDNLTEITGCLLELRVNNKAVVTNQIGSHFTNACYVNYTETVCTGGNCTSGMKEKHILDCSISSLSRERICNLDFLLKMPTNRSFDSPEGSTNEKLMKLIWKLNGPSNYCLMEIGTRNNSVILFYVNNLNELLMCMRNSQSLKCSSRSLVTLTTDEIYVMTVGYAPPNLTVKIPFGSGVKTFVETVNNDIKWVKVGFRSQENVCERFTENIAFVYYKHQFDSVVEFFSNTTQPTTIQTTATSHFNGTSEMEMTTIGFGNSSKILKFLIIIDEPLLLSWLTLISLLIVSCIMFLLFKFYRNIK